MHSPLLATLTHARLRMAQGDLRAARDILHELLAGDPGNAEARALLDSLRGRAGTCAPADAEPPVPPREPADPGELTRSFRILGRTADPARENKIRRLRDWAARIGGDARATRPGDD